jgi:hypothetical protein
MTTSVSATAAPQTAIISARRRLDDAAGPFRGRFDGDIVVDGATV